MSGGESPRLLSPRQARLYMGSIGRESFDRDIRPTLTPVRIGQRTYYDRIELDRWVDERTGQRQSSASEDFWMEKLRHGLAEDSRRPAVRR